MDTTRTSHESNGEVPLAVQILTSHDHDEVVIKGGFSSESENELQEPLITSHKIAGQSFPSRAVSFVQDKTFHDAVMNLCKAVLGATLMALPMAFKQLGWVTGASMYIIVAMLTFQTLVIIIEGAELTNTRSYSQLVQALMGKFVGNLLDITQVLQIIGLLVLLLLLVCDVLVGNDQNGLLHDWFELGGSNWFTSRWFILGVVCVFCLAPSLAIRDLSSLSFMSSLGVFMVVGFTLCLGIITIVAYVEGHAFKPPMWPLQEKVCNHNTQECNSSDKDDSSDRDSSLFMEITSLIPVALLGEVCHQNLMPTLHFLKPYTVRRARNVTFSALALATTIYIIASYFGVVIFGTNLNDDILTNLNVAGLQGLLGKGGAITVVSFIKIGFLVNLLGSYLVNAWPVRQIVIDRICVVYLLSISVKDVWKPIKLCGAICANLVAFIFPALVVIKLQPLKERGKYGIAKFISMSFAISVIIIGVLSGITGVYSAFHS